jgi:hypothetical protein
VNIFRFRNTTDRFLVGRLHSAASVQQSFFCERTIPPRTDLLFSANPEDILEIYALMGCRGTDIHRLHCHELEPVESVIADGFLCQISA